MDHSPKVAAVAEDLAQLGDALTGAAGNDLETAEGMRRDGVLAIGARLLTASLAAGGTGHAGPRQDGACGAVAGFEGDRPKQVQTLVGWIMVRRAYYAGAECGQGTVRWMPGWGWPATA